MKKNFFKKLSFVMALAMMLTMIAPAASVFAAAAPKLSATTKYLRAGEEGLDKYDFNVSNKGKGWSYKWGTTDKKVATVDKNGVTKGLSAGTAKICVKIFDKDGDWFKTLWAKVIVRDNIKTLTITNKPEGDKVLVNKEQNFNRDFTTFGGNTKTSGKTRWTVEAVDAANKDAATINDSGVFVATKAGEYKITARAFQSTEKYDLWKKDPVANADYVTATSEAYTVKVVGAMESAKQTTLSKVNVTFASEVTKDEVVKNITVSALVGTAKVKQFVKSVAMDATNKVATVELYANFNENATYVVDYTDMTPVQFTTATTKVEDVTSMVITSKEAYPNEAMDLKVTLFNKDMVDITTDALKSRVTFDVKSDKPMYFDSANKKVTIFNKGDFATIEATYHTYKWEAGKEVGAIVVTEVMTCVDKASAVMGNVTGWTIVNNSNPDFGNAKQKVAVEDAGYQLFAQVKKTNPDGSTTNVSSKDDSKITFSTADNTVLIVASNGLLTPIKEGVAVVVVKYDDKVVDAINVTVVAKRAAATMELDATSFALSNGVNADDTKKVTITLKDQLGDDIALKDAKIEKLAGSAAGTLVATGAIGSKEITFNGEGQAEGTYYYNITANGMTRTVQISVATPKSDTVINSFDIALSSKEIDTKFKVSDTVADYTETLNVNVFGYHQGVKNYVTTLGTNVTVVVTDPKGNDITVGADGNYKLAWVSGGVLQKAPTGTYKVTAYSVSGTLDRTNNNAIDVDYFTVKDTQAAPTIELKSRVFTKGAGDLEIVKECFTIKVESNDVTASLTDIVIQGTTDEKYVKSVKYTLTITAGVTYTYEIPVGYTVRSK